ncbi:hypothetical protein M569_12727, partial [Genlisea aurea]
PAKMRRPLPAKRKPGGWKSMPFILGNETMERLASTGLLANFMVFLLNKYHMDQVLASNVVNIWSGFNNFSPLIGAYVSDSYLGRFRTILIGSFASLLGMVTFTLIAWLPNLLPPPCQGKLCAGLGPTKAQLGVLVTALVFLSIGSGGIRPCSLPFGVDQFDSSTEKGRRGINSFFNWYYTSFTVILILSLTFIVYVQDSVSWVLGFGIPTIFMVISIVLFLVGTRFYVYVQPEGSIFSGIARVFVAACKKRKLATDGLQVEYYDPPSERKKFPLTNRYRFLNKAATLTEEEDGSSPNPWRLCSVQVVEETKCLLDVVPIWASGIIGFVATTQQGTFTLSQTQKMDRHMGPHFQIPAGSLLIISMLTIAVWLPIYDLTIVPYLRKRTKIVSGITLLQRMGIGLVFSVISMVVAGLIERMRRASSLSHPEAPISVFWLAPQLILMGFSEAFSILGQIEFYNKEFPENMSSVANSLFSITMVGASYLSTLLVNVVHGTTGRKGHPDWLTKDIDQGRVDYFYYLVAAMGVLNFGYFVWVARKYAYKSQFRVADD